MNTSCQIIVVEDDEPLNEMLCMFIRQQGFKKVTGLGSVEELFATIDHVKPTIVIQDFDLPGLSGLEAIKRIKPRYPKIDFIFLSGQRSIEIALDAIRNGAFDYIVKDNFAKENVIIKIKNLLRIQALEKNRKLFKLLLLVFCSLAIISWLLVFFVYAK